MNGKHAELIAIEALGKSENWQAYSWGSKDNGILIKGSIPHVDLFGKRTWSPLVDEGEFFVTKSMMEEWIKEYPSRTGNCPECCGEGLIFKSWNHIDGTKYDTCPVCGGTGKAPSGQVAALDQLV